MDTHCSHNPHRNRTQPSISQSLKNSERGQGLVEYALGLVLVGMVATAAVVGIGPAINDALCQAIESMNPAISDSCGGEEVVGGEITVMFAKYNASKGELDIQAKAPPDCPYDLEVVGMGTMERQGSSYVFKYEETTGSPPESVTVGHSECGYTTVPVAGG